MLVVVVLVAIVATSPDAISIAVLVALALSVVLLCARELSLSWVRRVATVEAVREGSALTMTEGEAARLIAAVELIITRWQERDARTPPPEIEIQLSRHPGTRLRLEFRPAPQHYAAVVIRDN